MGAEEVSEKFTPTHSLGGYSRVTAPGARHLTLHVHLLTEIVNPRSDYSSG